jgi:quaternary ammonium compound-resistance protein SugE
VVVGLGDHCAIKESVAPPRRRTYLDKARGTTLAPFALRESRLPGDGPTFASKGLAMAWIILFIAGLFEIGWAVGLKFTQGFTRPIPIVLTAISLVLSMGLLGWSVKSLPLGTAYAVWTGVGAVGTAIVGVVLFKEPATAARLVCLGLIVAGILGLKLVSPAAA